MNAIHTFNDECPSMCIWWDRLYVAELLLFWANEGKLRFNLWDYLVVSSPHYIATVENKLKAFYCRRSSHISASWSPLFVKWFQKQIWWMSVPKPKEKGFHILLFLFLHMFPFHPVTDSVSNAETYGRAKQLRSLGAFVSDTVFECAATSVSLFVWVCVTLSFWG